jgi:hypothetical protein
MPRFVVLRHECPPEFGKPSHWDVMLEDGGELLTWSVTELPTLGGPAVPATKLANHRLAYLDYEGAVSGDRGEVRRVDRGDFEWLERTPQRLACELMGTQLAGRLVFEALGSTGWQMQHGSSRDD